MTLSVKQMPLRDAARFFPDYDVADKIKAYAIFGGVPYYLQLCDRSATLRENVLQLLLKENGPLIDEPSTLLQTELRDLRLYSSILAAIAEGATTAKQIADRLHVETKEISPYLVKLERLDLILISKSMDADPKARNLHFTLNDHLIAFWHAFVRTNLTAINAGFGSNVYDTVIERDFPTFMGKAFEVDMP